MDYRKHLAHHEAQKDRMPPRVPAPKHRHGAPSGPWPFLDIDSEVDKHQLFNPGSLHPTSATPCAHILHQDPTPSSSPHDETLHSPQHPNQATTSTATPILPTTKCWCKYPQSLYPNWTPTQQKMSKLSAIIDARANANSMVYRLDVTKNADFGRGEEFDVKSGNKEEFWKVVSEGRPDDTMIRAIFVDNMSGPVLQMIGTRYNIEPFFFSSSIGWIPSRFRSNIIPDFSDHITITLTFVRKMDMEIPVSPTSTIAETATQKTQGTNQGANQMIDIQAPLKLRSSNLIIHTDHLALHMLRSPVSSTIVSLHTSQKHKSNAAKDLYTRFHAAGKSVYWNTIFRRSNDPTFEFLTLLWYALYAWDEAVEALYGHICFIESSVMNAEDMAETQELHIVRAHLLHYESLLSDFSKSVQFVLDTSFPALENLDYFTEEEKEVSQETMRRECQTLLVEIKRLEGARMMMNMRLKNVMTLGYSIVNIQDSRQMQKLTRSSIRDSEAMKQIAYLSMIFLPALFVTNIFGMNISEINPKTNGTIWKYFAFAIPLTTVVVWTIIAYQIRIVDPPHDPSDDEDEADDNVAGRAVPREQGAGKKGETIRKLGVLARIFWPVVVLGMLMEKRKMRGKKARSGRKLTLLL